MAVKVLFASDSDYAEFIADTLTDVKSSACIYSVIHNCYGRRIQGAIKISLCLPAKRPGSNKCLEVFKIQLPAQEATRFLFYGEQLSAKLISQSYSRAAAFSTFVPILEVLGVKCQRNEMKSIIVWNRIKFVAALRKMFKMSTSPYWLINTFGSYENHFILVCCHYFFVSHICTVDTLGHIALLFEKNKGKSLVSVATFQELSFIFNQSLILSKVEDFYKYVELKLQRDSQESRAIDRCVNEFRGQLVLSNQDLVHYIYLAFFQCLNNQKFITYSTQSKPEHLSELLRSPPVLVENINNDFKHKMATYYNKQTYLSNYVFIRDVTLKQVEGYSDKCLGPNEAAFKCWCGESSQVSELMHNINEEYPDIQLTEEFQGLLELAASGSRPSPLGDPKGYLSEDCENAVFPVYRCEFLNKHYFLAVYKDNISFFWQKSIFLPTRSLLEMASDFDLTRSISYSDFYYSMNSLKEQTQISRHEYFNSKLPVFNWVLDLDLPISGEGFLSAEEIWHLCLAIREAILDIMAYLFGHVEPNHQVYFFKSACSNLFELDPEQQIQENVYCTCKDKLGMRVITSFPHGVCVKGSQPMIQLTKILNRVVKLNSAKFKCCAQLQDLDGPFDTGIYNRGRSIRLPHTFKVAKSGRLERQLKIFICHPFPQERLAYVQNCLRLNRLLHHSRCYDWDKPIKTIYWVQDSNENFLYQQTQKQLPAKFLKVVSFIEERKDTTIVTYVSSKIWPRCYHTIKSYMPDDRLQQFARVSFSPTNQCIIQVRPERGSNFRCLRYNHRGGSKTVRVFLTLHLNRESKLVVTFMSQCFANKCNNNKPVAHFSVTVDL